MRGVANGELTDWAQHLSTLFRCLGEVELRQELSNYWEGIRTKLRKGLNSRFTYCKRRNALT